jgi:hypothetical protein
LQVRILRAALIEHAIRRDDWPPRCDEIMPLPMSYPLAGPTIAATVDPERGRFSRLAGRFLAPAIGLLLAFTHGLAIWIGLGGYAGLTNGWPLWKDDHPLYFHSALVTRSFLADSFTTAGYDPAFMSGYAKSVIFPASSTLPELVIAVFGGKHPELAYKLYVLLSAAAYPWLIALACQFFGVRGWSATAAVAMSLAYVWTDWPINYVAFGMLPYFLGIPLALAATGAFARFLGRRTVPALIVATALLTLSVLVHLTTAMVAAPAALLAYLAAVRRKEPPAVWTRTSHLAVWLIPVIVLALNAFWWLPGLYLASTKGDSGFAFSHSGEGVAARLANILWSEAPIESILLGAGLAGLLVLMSRSTVPGLALGGFCAAGWAWGYLAGAMDSLDFLQPGRHTFAFYSALAIAGPVALEEAARLLRTGQQGMGRMDRWMLAGFLLVALRVLGPSLAGSVRYHLWTGEPFLSSRPSTRLSWVVDRVRRHVKPGERLLYEEGGKDLPDARAPFGHGRFSGLLPWRTDVEVLGGPYLHASLTTNFTQFGEGKLFGRAKWDRDFFVRYARLYRPSAILCWSPHARAFCKANPGLIRVLEDDGTLLIGRVEGFGGDTIRGGARVEASPGRLMVRDLSPDLDGSVVLRYHFVPCLTSRSSVACEPEFEEQDPVPFIRLRPPPGIRDVELKMVFPGRP